MDTRGITINNLLDRQFEAEISGGSATRRSSSSAGPGSSTSRRSLILFSRFIVGWAVSVVNDRHLNPLQMALTAAPTGLFGPGGVVQFLSPGREWRWDHDVHVVVEKLVGIQVRAVAGQEHQADLVGACLEPLGHAFRPMHGMAVDDQKHGAADQPDQSRRNRRNTAAVNPSRNTMNAKRPRFVNDEIETAGPSPACAPSIRPTGMQTETPSHRPSEFRRPRGARQRGASLQPTAHRDRIPFADRLCGVRPHCWR